jgi:O-antigen ligase
MLSDIIRVTRPDQYLRGWARVGFVLTDFLSLAVITARDRRLLWWFGFGFGLGAIVFLAAVKHAPLSQWKIGYGEPSLLVLMALCAFLPARISSILLAGFALVSIFLDYRSLGALSLVSAGYLWIRARRPQEALAGVGPMFKILLAGGLVLAAISYGLSLSEDKEAATRRVDSNAGRKAAIEVGLIGIAQSPIIGYGSWTENKELAEMFLKRMREYGGDKQYLAHAGVLFLPHSQVLQAWLEGGILGTAFFLFLIYQLIRSGRWMILLRPLDRLTPFMLNFLLSGAWGIFMSPFGSLRISLALLAVIVFILKVESAVAKKSLN